MATLTPGYTFTSGEVITPTKLNSAASPTLATGTITNTDLASNAVTTTKIADANVTSVKIADGAVTAGKIADANVTTDKIADGAVTAGKIALGAIPASIPAGAVMPFACSTAPTGWLAANGNTIGSPSSGANNASADYSALFNVLWNNWTNTDLPILSSAGSTTTRGASASADFSANKRLPLPDLRGIFVRGSGSQTISARTFAGTFGTKQLDEFRSHSHSIPIKQDASGGGGGAYLNRDANTTTNSNATGGDETRPANISLLYCIKF